MHAILQKKMKGKLLNVCIAATEMENDNDRKQRELDVQRLYQQNVLSVFSLVISNIDNFVWRISKYTYI